MNTDKKSELEFAIAILTAKLEKEKKCLARFKATLEENPVYAFSWAGDAIRASVNIAELEYVLATFADDQQTGGLKRAADYYGDKVLSMARNTPASTSMMSNAVANYEREVAAEMLECLTELRGF